jgi:hypothetical protein
MMLCSLSSDPLLPSWIISSRHQAHAPPSSCTCFTCSCTGNMHPLFMHLLHMHVHTRNMHQITHPPTLSSTCIAFLTAHVSHPKHSSPLSRQNLLRCTFLCNNTRLNPVLDCWYLCSSHPLNSNALDSPIHWVVPGICPARAGLSLQAHHQRQWPPAIAGLLPSLC